MSARLFSLTGVAFDHDLAARRREDAAEDREERRLAGAGRPFERDDLAALDVEVDAAQHRDGLAPFAGSLFDTTGMRMDIGSPLECVAVPPLSKRHVRNTSAGSIDATLRNEIIAALRHSAIAPSEDEHVQLHRDDQLQVDLRHHRPQREGLQRAEGEAGDRGDQWPACRGSGRCRRCRRRSP